MIALGSKTKQFLIAFTKLLVAGAAIYALALELSDSQKHDWGTFFMRLDDYFSFPLAGGVLFLAFSNRFLEILKWSALASTVRKTGIGKATRQVLAGMAFGIVTPAGVGEYAGKAFFFLPGERKKIVFLNLICNGAQMMFTLLFGVFGLLYLAAMTSSLDPRIFLYTALALLFIGGMLLSIRRFTVRGWSVERIIHKINTVPRGVHRKTLLFALGRYLSFSHQQYLLLLLFGVRPDYVPTLMVIAGVYLLASCLPTFQLFDFAVKGSLSVYFFQLIGIDGLPVVCSATAMWVLNIVLPVLAGSCFVLHLKPNR